MANLHIRIDVDNADATKKLRETDQAVAGVEKSAVSASKGVSSLETSLSKVGQVAAGIAAVKIGVEGLTRFVGASVDSYSAAEDAAKKLTTALSAQGSATPKVIGQYEALAKTFQNTTKFSDDLITEMQSLLVQVGNVMPGDMEKALKASTDLSAGLGVDLRTATMLVGKAFAGETGALSRYGIVIDDAKVKSEGATAVLEALNQKFGGQAQAQLQTYSGQTALLGNKMDDLREQVGELVVRAVTPLLSMFSALPGPVQSIILGAGAMAVTLGPIALGFSAIAGAVGPLLPMLATALPAALSALGVLMGPAGLVIAGIVGIVAVWRNWDAIVGFAKGVYEGVKTWMVDKFNAIVQSIKDKIEMVTGFFGSMYDKVVGNSFVPDMITGIGKEFDKLDGLMVKPTEFVTKTVGGLFSGLTDKLSGLLGGKDSAFGKILHGGLGSLFSAGGPLMGLVGMGMDAIGGLVSKGVSKLGSMIGGLFTGSQPNDERDAWFSGRSVGDIGNELAPFMDGESARQMIEKVFNSKNKKDLEALTKAIDRVLGRAHTGGVIQPWGLERFHSGGILPDERTIIGQTGEGILNRRAMANLGAKNLHAMNRGEAPAGVTVNIAPGAVVVHSVIESPLERRRIAEAVGEEIMQDIRLRSRAS